ncbi:MAG TPA: hypothetical protein VLV49_06425 [Terriglobales bacterium]|nr:hypothetical protein [Terriglobales bacterium]
MPRPAGVTAVAILFLLAGGYLCLLGLLLLFAPASVSLLWGTFLLDGLALAGPYMFLLAGAIGLLIAWGVARLNRWARRAAALIALAGVVLLLPNVSIAATELRWPALCWGALGVIVRVVVAWYLYQAPVAQQFGR